MQLMERGSTLLLKITVCLMGISILALCTFGLPWIANEAAKDYPTYWLYPALIGFYAMATPIFVASYQALRLLSYIDKNKAFSELSVRALKNIKYCAFTVSILFVVCMPFIFHLA